MMNIKSFDLNLLRVFAAVDSERNVSRAAAQIGLSQPAMSNALSRLRKACNDPLFVRTPTGMEPSALALEMAGAVHEALSRLDLALGGAAEFDPSRVSRTFRLLMSDAGQLVVLPALMKALTEQAPRVIIESAQVPREQHIDALQNGFADLAIGNLSTLRSGIHEQHLFDDTFCCIASHNHPVLRGGLTLKQFMAAKHVMIASGTAEPHLERVWASRKSKREVSLSVSQYHIAIEAVRETNLVATVPRFVVQSLDSVQILDLPFAMPAAQVRQFWHRRVDKDPANSWLRSYLRILLENRGMGQKRTDDSV